GRACRSSWLLPPPAMSQLNPMAARPQSGTSGRVDRSDRSGVSSRHFWSYRPAPALCRSRRHRRIPMIHHVSIPAREPQHVAGVLADLMGGKSYPFGPLEGAFMAASGDAHGTMIEVYPERATLDIPANDDQVVFGDNPSPPQTWLFHVLLLVPL